MISLRQKGHDHGEGDVEWGGGQLGRREGEDGVHGQSEGEEQQRLGKDDDERVDKEVEEPAGDHLAEGGIAVVFPGEVVEAASGCMR